MSRIRRTVQLGSAAPPPGQPPEEMQQQGQPQGFGFQPQPTYNPPVPFGTPGSGTDSIYRLAPYYYIHVLDLTSNVTRVEVGPQTFIRHDNERVVLAPERMITVPPRHYCVVENPVIRDANQTVVLDTAGQVKLAHADLEIRLTQEPFPLYPGEILKTAPTPLRVVPANSALRLKAVLDFEDATGEKRVAGDEWLFEGPGTYIPRKEVGIEETVRASVIKPNQALKLRARRETVDRTGNARVTGEEWLISKVGAYLPGAYEEVVDIVDAHVLSDKTALKLQATKTFTDQFGKMRKNGEEWLIKVTDSETYIPEVYEKVVDILQITTLDSRQYCVILNPVGADGKPQLGKKKLVKGEKSFFLQPGESLEQGIQNVYVLGENEGLVLKANESFLDGEIQRQPGDLWLIRGPTEYVPSVEMEVVSQRTAIPLDENEGIYVRDIKSGRVRAVVGHSYMLTQDEELWEKALPSVVEGLLTSGRDPLAERSSGQEMGGFAPGAFPASQALPIVQPVAPSGGKKGSRWDKREHLIDQGPRNKTRVVTFRVPHNAAVQVYDYKEKKARVVFGPDLVMLMPDEHFTQLSLSGGRPKRPNMIKSLCLLLGPDFMTDIVTVETSDHARLQIQLSYNWYFDSGDKSVEVAAKLFSVPDFVGDACKAVASRVRGMVAQVQFDDFHKNSARIIRTAVFGVEEGNRVRDRFVFPQNNLNITSVDIQSVEPVDQRTRDALQKSVQLAIEITTNSQEAAARHEAQRIEQEAKGRLERQKITDEAEAEKARKDLLELQAASAAVESTGQAKAEAQSRAESSKIEGEAAVDQARLRADANKIDTESELSRLEAARQADIKYQREKAELEISRAKEMGSIETQKFQNMVGALGASTIQAIATAGPETQVKLLQSLGLQTALITDGKSPINLFQTANGLIGALEAPKTGLGRRKRTDEDDDTAEPTTKHVRIE